jgi:hypothetical protein
LFTIYTTLSTSPNLRYVRRFAWLVLGVILLVFVGSTLLFTRSEGGAGRSVSAPILVVAYLIVVVLLLLPLPVVVWRRAGRVATLAKTGADRQPVAAYLLPNVREFVDRWGRRASNALDQTVILTQSENALSLWSGGGPFDVMCEIPMKDITAAAASSVDGYRSVLISFRDRDDLELVLCGRVFGIDQSSVTRVVDELNASRQAQSRPTK